jgi:hypothetical protein
VLEGMHRFVPILHWEMMPWVVPFPCWCALTGCTETESLSVVLTKVVLELSLTAECQHCFNESVIAVFSFQVHRFAYFPEDVMFFQEILEKPKLTWTANVHHIASPRGCNRVRTAAIERENKSDQLLVACQY